VARDRQRAKQRKQKRQPQPPSRQPGNGDADAPADAREELAPEGEALAPVDPDRRSLHRENVPGPVEHTGDVDQFEAELVAGADGEPADDPDAAEQAALGSSAADVEESTGASAAPVPVAGGSAPTQDAHGRGGRRFANFLRASWAELQRVQWPDRRQVGQATGVTLGFVVVAGAYLGLADVVADKLVNLII
jgi:preprotein translocase SecE subunit